MNPGPVPVAQPRDPGLASQSAPRAGSQKIRSPQSPSLFGFPAHQQKGADKYSTNPCPDRNIHVLLLVHRDVQRAKVSLMGFFGVGEASVGQPKGATNYQ